MQAPCGAAIGAVPLTEEILKVQYDPLRVIRIVRKRVQGFRLTASMQD